MGWRSWITRKHPTGSDSARRGWHAAWRNAVNEALAEGHAPDGRSLEATLDALALPPDEVEIEREMLDGYVALLTLRRTTTSGPLPLVTTGHRIVGADACYFSAPASLPDDPSQPSGRFMLTSTRALFVGGARAVTLPWHGVAEVVEEARDLVLARRDRETFVRFRCNQFADALCATFLARRLTRRDPGR